MPKEDNFAAAAAQQVLQTPASITADGSASGVDITAFKGECMVVAAALKVAGTNPTMDITIEVAPDADVIDSVSYVGTGDGTLTEVTGGPDAIEETVTIHMANATTAEVSGSVTGAIGTATVGTKFTSPQINFLITAGAEPFVHTDEFSVDVLARVYEEVAAFTQVTTSGSIQRKVLNIDELGPFVRTTYDIGGTDSPEYIIGVSLYGLQR